MIGKGIYTTSRIFSKLRDNEKEQIAILFNSILGNACIGEQKERDIVEHLVNIFGLKDKVHIDEEKE